MVKSDFANLIQQPKNVSADHTRAMELIESPTRLRHEIMQKKSYSPSSTRVSEMKIVISGDDDRPTDNVCKLELIFDCDVINKHT